MGCGATRMRWKQTPQAATPHHRLRRSLSSRRSLFIRKINFCYIFYNPSESFYNKQKRFYKTFDSFHKTSNIVYNVCNFATQPIMYIKMLLQFNFSLRLGRKVRSTENRVIGTKKEIAKRFLFYI